MNATTRIDQLRKWSDSGITPEVYRVEIIPQEPGTLDVDNMDEVLAYFEADRERAGRPRYLGITLFVAVIVAVVWLAVR